MLVNVSLQSDAFDMWWDFFIPYIPLTVRVKEGRI